MNTTLDHIKRAIDNQCLFEVMEWDSKHGPTEGQWQAFCVLFPEAVSYRALEDEQQRIEDERFNSSVWEDWEQKVQEQEDRDHAISDAEHPIHQLVEYEANCM